MTNKTPRPPLPSEGYDAGMDEMVERLRLRYKVGNEGVLNAMRRVRRHRFIPGEFRAAADPYGDHPCAIGMEQTVSQPYIVAYMLGAAGVGPGVRVLEVGGGSGYLAAVAAEMGADVRAVERIASLAMRARATLAEEGYPDVQVRTADGREGWPEQAPYDAIIVSCAVADVPPALGRQLADGGKMILPLGQWSQRLVILARSRDGITETGDMAVRFVPMLEGVAG